MEPTLDVVAAHDIAVDAHHALLHAVPRLIEATVHVSPRDNAHHDRLAHHREPTS